MIIAALPLIPLVAAQLSGSFRRDVYLKDFPEGNLKAPSAGGRVHLILGGLHAVEDSQLSSVQINDQECLGISEGTDLTYFDWCRAHVNPETGFLWVSFHTRNTAWVPDGSKGTLSFEVNVTLAAGGGAFINRTSIALAPPAIELTYVATRDGGAEAVLHVHATSASALEGMTFNGEDVALPPSAASMPAGSHLVITHRPARALNHSVGAVWAASLRVGGASVSYGGRSVPERFPIEAWPHSPECPLPGANDANAAAVADKFAVDSIYYGGGSFGKNCGKPLTDVVEALAANSSAYHVVTDAQTAAALSAAGRTRVDAVLCGDEVDGKLDADHLRSKLSCALSAIRQTPTLPTYQGSKTSRLVGAFAGISDIQGSDAYCAACAPTMLPVDRTLPLQYPFLYLRNARDNTMPLPLWGYAQLYSDAWSYQADANELVAQIGQAVLSGSKAMMLFQANLDQQSGHKAAPIKEALRNVRALREELRTGDVGGAAFTCSSRVGKEVMVETIVSPARLVVAIVNTDASGYSNLLCHTFTSKHWAFKKHTIDSLQLGLPLGAAELTHWREAKGGALTELTDVHISAAADAVTLRDISLDDEVPFRMLVADVKWA